MPQLRAEMNQRERWSAIYPASEQGIDLEDLFYNWDEELGTAYIMRIDALRAHCQAGVRAVKIFLGFKGEQFRRMQGS